MLYQFAQVKKEESQSILQTSNTKVTLNAIKRAVLWSTSPDTETNFKEGVEGEFGISKVSEDSCKSFMELLYAIVAADGELGVSEEEYITRKTSSLGFDKLLGVQALQNVLQYNMELIAKAKAGEFVGVDIARLATKHADSLSALGITGDIQQATANAVLCEAIIAASTDGYSVEEQRAASTAAGALNVDRETFILINRYAELESKLNNNPSLENDQAFNLEILTLFSDVANKSTIAKKCVI